MTMQMFTRNQQPANRRGNPCCLSLDVKGSPPCSQKPVILHYPVAHSSSLLTYLLTSLLTYLLTYLLHRPESSLTGFAANQEIPRILWNPKFHHRIHKCPPPVHILSQLDPVHTSTSHLLKIHLNIIVPSTPGSSKWSLSFSFPHQTPVYTSPVPQTSYMSRPTHSCRLYHPNNSG